MAVQAHFAGSIPPPPCAGLLVEDQMWAAKDYSALLFSAAHDGGCPQHGCAGGVVSAAQSDLTCNGGGGGAVTVPSRKRAWDDELERYRAPASTAALLPIPGMPAPATLIDTRTPSTSGRPTAAGIAAPAEDALVAELCRQQGAEIDALVQAECDRLRAGLEQAAKRQRQAVARAAASCAARALRAKEAEIDAARRRAAGLEELLRQAAAETHAWRGAARGTEAVAAGLRATLDAVLLRGAGAPARQPAAEEGSGESDPDDAQSCCFVPDAERARLPDAAATATATSSGGNNNGRCRACGGGEASVLVLPCRHLCLCKACEPRWDACPVCLAAKNASIHGARQLGLDP